MDQQNILSAIESLNRTVAALQGDMKGVGAAIARIQEFQGIPESYSVNTDEPDLSVPQSLMTGEIRVGEIASESDRETETPSTSPEVEPEPLVTVEANVTVELETVATDPGQAGEEEPSIIVAIQNDKGDESVLAEEHSAREETSPESEVPSPELANVLDSTGDVLENALSEIRMMMDRFRFVGMDPDQAEQMMQQIAATREGVLTLDAVVTEIRNEVQSGREALAAIQSAMPDPAALDNVHGLVVEQNDKMEMVLTQLLRVVEEGTRDQEALLNLANYLSAELAKVHEPLNASQKVMSQVLGLASGIDGMKSKLAQTWVISLFWLGVVVIYIVLRGAMGLWG